MRNFVKKQTGITLIALVVTIIVLIILAGVSIAMLVGENGIITQAQRAAQETEQAQVEEQRQLAMLEATMNTENQPYTDKNGDTATIPAGFAVSQIEGENTIDDGLVIIDANGNEFVWVPVDYNREIDDFAEIFVRREGYSNGSLQSYLSKCGEADSSGINQYLENVSKQETKTTQAEAQAMYASVKENGGFYIGRYEAGKDSKDNVIVKKGADVYDCIPWSANGYNMQETEGTTGGAVELARNFDTVNNYTSVTSTLIYGVQWDAIMKWMKDIENKNVEGKMYIQDSIGMGWHSDNSGRAVHQTGIDVDSNKSNCVNNIYDLAGNVYEWTMESYGTASRINRGGNWYFSASEAPTSARNFSDPSLSNNSIGFRLALYL